MAQENLTDVIEKRFGDAANSLSEFLKLCDPKRTYDIDLKTSKAWSDLPLPDQRKLYLYLLYRKWRGIDIYGEPYYIIKNCHPVPFNWNGHPGAKFLIETKRAVKANFRGDYGIYTWDESHIYGMTEIKLLN